jgi:hypothetical protein
MVTFLVLGILYFLPLIIGRDKPHAMSIFLLNFFLGWTLIGWIAAFIWACSSERRVYLQYAPLAHGHFCSRCGIFSTNGAHFCGACGRTV